MASSSRASSGTILGVIAVVLAVAACDRSSAVSPNRLDVTAHPATWPSDGLLADPALQAIAEIQSQGVTTGLVALLYGGTAAERARAALAMGSIREGFGFQAVADQLTHADSRVRAASAFAVSQMPRPEVTTILGNMAITEPDSVVRRHMVDGLGISGTAEAVDGLLTQQVDVPEVTLVLALGRIAMRSDTALPAAVDRLALALSSTDGASREMAAWYFGRSDAQQWASRTMEVREALAAVALDDPAAGGLLRAVARLEDVADVGDIVRFLDSPDWRLRVRAASALGPVAANDSARAALFGALDDASTHVAVAAAGSVAALRRLLDADMERMERWITDHPEEWRVALPLLGGLAAQGRAGFVRDWVASNSDRDLAIRAQGISALARAPDQGITRSLMLLAANDTVELATAALQGLVARWPADRDNLELRQSYWDVFEQALQRGDRAGVTTVAPVVADSVFVEMGSIELLGTTYTSLTPVEDVGAALTVVDALFATGRSEALVPLRTAMVDPHLEVRVRARDHIQLLSGSRAQARTDATVVGRELDWTTLASLGRRPRLVLETEKGRVVIVMATDLAPLTVQTISEFASEGLYDGVIFHRVVPDFVIQGGDFQRRDGYGGPGFVIRTEITGIPFQRGVVGMASYGPDTEGSQFFITHSAAPHLDRGYTAFGWVVEGMDVVDTIYERDRIVSASVQPDSGAGSAGETQDSAGS